MRAYRIQIIKAKLQTYWYANHTGETYWASENLKKNLTTDDMGYQIINEGLYTEKYDAVKWVNKDDCVVLKEADITVKKVTMVQVIENV